MPESERGDIDSQHERERLEAALKIAPRGAFALAGAAVLLLILIWFLFYFLVFIPRGVVG